MAEEKRITISRTLNGNTIYYIARNSSGSIFARTLTLKELEAAIKIYKEPPPLKEEGEPASVDSASVATPASPKPSAERRSAKEATPAGKEKKFLTNKLSRAVQKRKGQSKKKTFWDRLK